LAQALRGTSLSSSTNPDLVVSARPSVTKPLHVMSALRPRVLILSFSLYVYISCACVSEAKKGVVSSCDLQVSGCPSDDIAGFHDVSLLQVARSVVSETGLTRETRISLWDGMDRVGEDSFTRNLEEQPYLPWGPHANETLLVLGPFDSGTHLMIDQLFSNYPRLMPKICAEYEETEGCGLIWKHGVEHHYKLADITANTPKVKVIMMVRSPFSLLAAWKKAPYNLWECMSSTSWSQTANDTCIARIGWTASGQKATIMQFRGAMDIYNHYMRQYSNISYHSGLITQIVPYEDLVYSPEMVMQAVATRFGWPMHNDVTIIESPSKDHGDPVGRSEALAKFAIAFLLG